MPYRSIRISSALPPADAARRIQALVRPRLGFLERDVERLFPSDDRPFEGDVHDRTFTILRFARYQTSFQPVIEGEILPGAAGGSIITLEMTPKLSALLPLGILFLAAFLFGSELAETQGWIAGLVPIGAVFAGAGIMCILFFIAAHNAEARLRGALRS